MALPEHGCGASCIRSTERSSCVPSHALRDGKLTLLRLRSVRVAELLSLAECARSSRLLSPSMQASWLGICMLEAKHAIDIGFVADAVSEMGDQWTSCFAGVSLWRCKSGTTASLMRWPADESAIATTDGKLAIAVNSPVKLGGLHFCNATELRAPLAIVHRESDDRWSVWCIADAVSALQLHDSWILLARDRMQL